ncbi:MAG TPA: hypothetical protein VGV87_08535 [Blastocatellia bacterium]|jgi:hypothetical protein|nr:hypothetical protein [Blastocatellia bacterium]
MKRLLTNWPRLAFIFVPLCIVVVDGAVLVHERNQPETEKAMRMVRESVSRKESFTVQQYVYATVYHRKTAGEEISIEGWRAERPPDEDYVVVEFSFTDGDGRHVATWRADVEERTVVPQDQLARDLSWRQ